MLSFCILAVVTFLVYFNAIQHPFVHDDVVFILHNPQISKFNFVEIFFPSGYPQTIIAGLNSYYRPVLELFTRLEYYFFGFNAPAFHLVNIVVHIANGLLLFALLIRLQFLRTLAFGISFLFLIHPVQTEAVACVSGFSNLLCSFFLLMSLHCYIKEKHLGAFAFFILAILTKEQAIMFLPLVVLVDWYRAKNKYLIWLGFATFTCGFLLLRLFATGSHLSEDILRSPGEFYLRVLSIPNTIVMYLRLIIAPYDLHYYRNTDILANSTGGFVVLGVLASSVTLLIKKFPDIRREVLFGLGWFLICLFPVLNIVPLINEYSFILTAEHFLYLAMIGIAITMTIILKRLLSSVTLAGLTVIVFSCFMVISIYQNTFWRNEEVLFERTILFEEKFARGHILLARAYYANQKVDLSIEQYEFALAIMKDYYEKASNLTAKNFYKGYIKEIYSDLSFIFMKNNQFEEALQARSNLEKTINSIK